MCCFLFGINCLYSISILAIFDVTQVVHSYKRCIHLYGHLVALSPRFTCLVMILPLGRDWSL